MAFNCNCDECDRSFKGMLNSSALHRTEDRRHQHEHEEWEKTHVHDEKPATSLPQVGRVRRIKRKQLLPGPSKRDHVACLQERNEVDGLILRREAALAALKDTIHRQQARWVTGTENEPAGILVDLQQTSVLVVESIARWQAAMGTTLPFFSKGRNYLEAMARDMHCMRSCHAAVRHMPEHQNPFCIPAPPLFSHQEQVLARFCQGSLFYPATVTSMGADGSYRLRYADGDEESNVHERCIRSKASGVPAAAAAAPAGAGGGAGGGGEEGEEGAEAAAAREAETLAHEKASWEKMASVGEEEVAAVYEGLMVGDMPTARLFLAQRLVLLEMRVLSEEPCHPVRVMSEEIRRGTLLYEERAKAEEQKQQVAQMRELVRSQCETQRRAQRQQRQQQQQQQRQQRQQRQQQPPTAQQQLLQQQRRRQKTKAAAGQSPAPWRSAGRGREPAPAPPGSNVQAGGTVLQAHDGVVFGQRRAVSRPVPLTGAEQELALWRLKLQQQGRNRDAAWRRAGSIARAASTAGVRSLGHDTPTMPTFETLDRGTVVGKLFSQSRTFLPRASENSPPERDLSRTRSVGQADGFACGA
jgi:hypothetical protein